MNPKSQFIRNLQISATAIVAVLLIGCSGSQPSAGDGKRAVLDRIQNESEGRIKLVSFKKTNGQLGELMGVQFYSLEYQAEIEFTEDCKWVTKMFGLEKGFRTVKPVAEPRGGGFSWNKFMDETQNPGNLVKQGHRETLSGKITFEKTEQGWRAARM